MLGCSFYIQCKKLFFDFVYWWYRVIHLLTSLLFLFFSFFFYRFATKQTIKSPRTDPRPLYWCIKRDAWQQTQERNKEPKRECGGIWGEDPTTYLVISTKTSNGSIRWDDVHHCLCIAWVFLHPPILFYLGFFCMINQSWIHPQKKSVMNTRSTRKEILWYTEYKFFFIAFSLIDGC
jgi:hypothetical protein